MIYLTTLWFVEYTLISNNLKPFVARRRTSIRSESIFANHFPKEPIWKELITSISAVTFVDIIAVFSIFHKSRLTITFIRTTRIDTISIETAFMDIDLAFININTSTVQQIETIWTNAFITTGEIITNTSTIPAYIVNFRTFININALVAFDIVAFSQLKFN